MSPKTDFPSAQPECRAKRTATQAQIKRTHRNPQVYRMMFPMMFPFRGTHDSVAFFTSSNRQAGLCLDIMLAKLAINTKRKKRILPNPKEQYKPGGKKFVGNSKKSYIPNASTKSTAQLPSASGSKIQCG